MFSLTVNFFKTNATFSPAVITIGFDDYYSSPSTISSMIFDTRELIFYRPVYGLTGALGDVI